MNRQIVYRLATETDIEPTYDLFRAATGDLLAQSNRALPPASAASQARSFAFRRHALQHDAARFWIAEADHAPVGFGVAALRDRLWYLAALHVLPGWQGQGIGKALLQRCQDAIPPETTRIVISDSLNPHSNLLYARNGMIPSEPLFELSGPVEPARSHLEPVVFEGTATEWEGLDWLDLGALGSTRRPDHAFWLDQPNQALLTMSDHGRMVGYAYASGAGIGPAAGRDESTMQAVIQSALNWLHLKGQTRASLKLPGSARAGLAWLLSRGFRFDHILLIGASDRSLNLDRYAVSVADALF